MASLSMVQKSILQQIGGAGRVAAMTGCQFIIDGENKIMLHGLKRAKKNHIEITLNSMDLYTVRFVKIRAGEIKADQTIDNVYCEDLKSLIEQETGLYLSL